MTVEVKIGVQQTARELVIEADSTSEDISAQVSEALASDGVLTLEFAEHVAERLRHLQGQWKATPFGETMELTFDAKG